MNRIGLVWAAAAAASLAGCATTYDDYGRRGGYGLGDDYRYEGSAYARRGGGPFDGPGADVLDPWLAETDEGQQIVRMGWRGVRDGWIDEDVARRANVWFRRYADEDRDMCLTDAEIRTALVTAARGHDYARR
ncbi:hypothetical protein [Allosphingosinicella sp.]|uniref:hypothetical protein n=1 Tax=Allosphingosinicella sp. TaxID=2823234 RepID=UPI002F010966